MTGKREAERWDPRKRGQGCPFAQERRRGSAVEVAGTPASTGSKHQRQEPKAGGNFKAESGGSALPPRTADSNWVSKVGGKLNSAWFLIAPACDFLTDAITAN
ncbi:unnamed protein product [Tetraodon nigroviridis]|uniref:(spotted green pufferfish) hypothetical protein n=1 Tax=Tetraodon nigroviridis TaxID=99883 RepID=Q4T0W4_TETNG|nr:unnamed protein product [Tetraodon nigroviridis]